MLAFKRIKRSNFFIKLRNWEYWPFGILQFPIFIYWFWLSLKSRSLLFFTSSNPGIPMGGMFGESKFDILKKIPEQYKPKTLLVKIPVNVAEIKSLLTLGGFEMPIIFKPDIGERGFMVKRIRTDGDIVDYISRVPGDFLIQELVDLPLEFGVFYMRLPDEPQGRVTSVVMKEMLTVTGDGFSTLKELILAKDRAKLQWQRLQIDHKASLDLVPEKGKTLELVSIGNHALGTTFLDGSHLINQRLSQTFDAISQQIEGFYFGRFDLRCATIADLYEGKVKILELNGCGAEPAHIYDPGYPLFKAIQTLLVHWENIYKISKQNRVRGVNPLTLIEGLGFYRKFKSLIK